MYTFGDYQTDLDVRGVWCATIPPNTTQNLDWVCPGQRYLTGIRYEKTGGGDCDEVDLQIIHPASGAILKQFGTKVYILSNGRDDFYKAVVPAGLIIRAVYKNTDLLAAAHFKANLILHKDRVIV